MTKKELLQKIGDLNANATAICDKATAEDREMTDAEQEQFDAIYVDVDAHSAQVTSIEANEDRRSRTIQTEAWMNQSGGRATTPHQPNLENIQTPAEPIAINYGNGATYNALPGSPLYEAAQADYMAQFESFLQDGQVGAALQLDGDTSGGYLVPPGFLNTLIQAKDNETFFRTIANVLQPTTAKSVGAPSLDADPSDPEWTSEIGTRSEDSTMAFGGRELTPHPLAKLLKLSNKLVRSVPNIGTLVAERLGYKQATTEENAFLNGDGAGVPLGVFKASAAGISTGRDVTASAATSFKFDDIIDLEHKVAEQYRESCIFLVHDDFIKRARKLKDGNGQYLWQPSVQLGVPAKINGRDYKVSAYAPNTFTSGQYTAIFGDFKWYWIQDSLHMLISVLNELYAATRQTGYVIDSETDGMPVLEAAFARLKMA